MSFKMPSTQQVRELDDSFCIGVTESYANSLPDFIKPFADGYRLIASLPHDRPEIKCPRGGYYRPEGEENRLGAWIAKTHIKGANSASSPEKIAVR
jgi:amidase